MTKRSREDEVVELASEERRPAKEARAKLPSSPSLDLIMEAPIADAVAEPVATVPDTNVEDAAASMPETGSALEENTGEFPGDETLAEILTEEVDNNLSEEIDDGDNNDDYGDGGEQYRSTDETFKDFSMDVLDFIWPKERFETMTTPDGEQHQWSAFLEMAQVMRGDKAEVIVGQNKTRFLVPEALLCRSPYFRAAFQGRFKESQSKRSVLPDIDTVSFKFIVEAMLLGRFNHSKIPGYSELRSTGQPHTTVENRTTINIWLNLIYVADQLQLVNLREEAEATVEDRLKEDREMVERRQREERFVRRPTSLPTFSATGGSAAPVPPASLRARRRGYLRPETIIEVFDKAPHNARLQDIIKTSVFYAIRKRWVKVEKYNDFLMEHPEVAIEWMTKLQKESQDEEERQREEFLDRALRFLPARAYQAAELRVRHQDG